ncbi:serine/threonine-protein kinase [Streptomyces sp. NRRL F-525]|uniref:serine/threonine-protein kinase n=1 Tax=Streptomyces sp. NRRL F-525 TaxID=1463861 RepID=UPI00068922A3|nr:protein kinase [Streptomyces sp. NRRL F-525]
MTPEEPTGPLETRLERVAPASPPIGEALRTRLESPQAPDAPPSEEVLTVLPKQLAARFRLVSELPAAGAEANLLLVTDEHGEHIVAKIYRRTGQQASREVWAKIPQLNNPHIVRILETGEAGQRDYELMEYVHGGNLAELVGGRATDGLAAMVTETVRQIAGALGALHGVGIIHQDLKPENVLVRSRDPLDLALSDFGVSRVLDQTRAAAGAAGTLAYLAPELLLSSGGQTSRARDWWALGMVARELVLGQRPFEDMVKPAIDAAVMLRGIDLDGVTDLRLRMLCAGLLTRDPADRWGASQVATWLAGGSPPVSYTTPPAVSQRTRRALPLVLRSVRYSKPEDLATALAEPEVWHAAARSYFTDMGPAHHPSEGWRALRKWLRQFDEPDEYDVETLQDLIDHRLTDPELGPDARVVRLVHVLAPETPVMCRGLRVDRENLLAIARHAIAAQSPDDDYLRFVEALWHQNLLIELAEYPASSGLRSIDEAWRTAQARYEETFGRLRQLLPPATQQNLSVPLDARTVIAPLLCLVLSTQEDGTRMWQQLDQSSAWTATVPWFVQARQQAGGGPGALVALRQLVPVALAEAEQTARRTAAAQAAHREQMARWQHMEAERTSPGALATATSRAVGPFAGYAGVMLLLALLGSQFPDDKGLAVASLVIGLILLFVHISVEVTLARHIGGPYVRGYTLFSQAGGAFSRAGRPRGAGFGCLILLFACPVLAFPAIAYGGLLVLHLRSVPRRRALWDNQLAAAYARVVSQR